MDTSVSVIFEHIRYQRCDVAMDALASAAGSGRYYPDFHRVSEANTLSNATELCAQIDFVVGVARAGCADCRFLCQPKHQHCVGNIVPIHCGVILNCLAGRAGG